MTTVAKNKGSEKAPENQELTWDEEGNLDIGWVYCDNLDEVARSNVAQKIVTILGNANTRQGANTLLSDKDFSSIESIYKKVYVDDNRILPKAEYDLLIAFLKDVQVKKDLVKLFDDTKITMKGTSAKQKKLKEELLDIYSNYDKFVPIFSYLKGILDSKEEVGEYVVFGYQNLKSLYTPESSSKSSEENKEDTRVFSYRTSEGFYNIFSCHTGIITEAKVKDYQTISESHICKGTVIFSAERNDKWGYLALIDNELVEISGFDYESERYGAIDNLREIDSQILLKETGKGLISFDGKEIGIETSFDFTHIGEEKTIGGFVFRECTKETGKGFLYKTESGWKETSFDIRSDFMNDEGGLCYFRHDDETYSYHIPKENNLLSGGEGYSNISNRNTEYTELLLEKDSKKGVVCQAEDKTTYSCEIKYLDIEDFDDKGFAVARLDAGYGLLRKADNTISEVSKFDFSTKLELDEYKDYVLEKKTGKGLADFSEVGIVELSDFDYVSIGDFNAKSLAVALKGKGAGVIRKGLKGELREKVRATTSEFIYVRDELEKILEKGYGIYEVTKGEGKDVLKYTSDGVFSAFEFDVEDVDQFSSGRSKFLVKKAGSGWGLMKKQGKQEKIIIPDAFDFDEPWDLDSDEPQSVTKGGKRYMIRNTETGIEVVMDLSEYVSIDPNINEGQIQVAEKESGVGVVMMKDGKLQDVSEFIYDEIGTFNLGGLSIAKQGEKVGLLLFDGNNVSEVSMRGERLIGEAKEQTSFTFSDIELEKEGKIPGAYLVIGTLRDGKTKVILRYFQGVIEQISRTSFSEVGEKDENNIMICREGNNNVCVMFIDYEQQGIGKGKIHSLEIGDEQYVNIKHVTKKWYIGETEQGVKKILLCQGNSMEVGEVDFEALLFHEDTGLCEGKQKDGGGIGYFFLKDDKIESHIESGLSEPIDMYNILTPQVIPRNDGTSSIISFTRGMFYEAFKGDVEEIESDVEIQQGNLIFFKNSEGLWGCLQCVPQLGGMKLHIVIPPSHKEGIMTKKGGEVHIPKEGFFTLGGTDCIFPEGQ